MLVIVLFLVVALTAFTYVRRHNLFLWIGTVMAWVWFLDLCAGAAGDLLRHAWDGLFGAKPAGQEV